MNKKQTERVATIALTAFLVGMFFYQVAHATNESSYKYGFKQGKSEFVNCQDFEADCSAAPDDCQSPVYLSVKNETSGYYIPVKHYDIMTNQTACMDGIGTVRNIYARKTEQLVCSCLKTTAFQMEVFYGMQMAQPTYVMWRVFYVAAPMLVQMPLLEKTVFLQTKRYIGIRMHVLDGLECLQASGMDKTTAGDCDE